LFWLWYDEVRVGLGGSRRKKHQCPWGRRELLKKGEGASGDGQGSLTEDRDGWGENLVYVKKHWSRR